MERLARLVMHHRRIVSAIWLALFLGGLFSAGQLGNRWTLDFSLPGQPGDSAEQQLIDTYGVSTFDTLRRRGHGAGGPDRRGERATRSTGSSRAAVAAVPRRAAARRRLRQHGRPGLRHRRRAHDVRPDPGAGPDHVRARTSRPSSSPRSTKAADRRRASTSGLTSYGLLSAGGDSGGTERAGSRRCSAPRARCSCCSSCSRRSWRCCRCSSPRCRS